jgi:hypothetical protein
LENNNTLHLLCRRHSDVGLSFDQSKNRFGRQELLRKGIGSSEPIRPTSELRFAREKCSFQIENGNAVVRFPFTLNEMKDATVKVYCPSNNAFDASYNLTASSDSAFAFTLPTGIPSRYNIEVFWKKDGKEFYYEEIIGHKHVH